ncbi:caspase-7-like [Dreissena polymorpha]|uniref:Uncharacterized protein n=1 Tax=Dreissena polymorpha TaxID=45954 RepID=A0A9D4FXA6_DREPO|nr:caspase-7-like [Dreissena polymorpha]KAH3806086.1 hypothetical protein DPMN_134400 [Dreissena polymorpha]
MAEIPDTVRERHVKLKTDIVAEFVTGSDEYNAFVEAFKAQGIPKGKLGNAKSLFDKFTLLESSGKLAPGNYDALINIASVSNCLDIVTLIRTADADIKSMLPDCPKDISGPSTSNGTRTNKRAAEDPPCRLGEPKKNRVSSLETDEEDPIRTRDLKGRSCYDYKDRRGYLLIINYTNGRNAADHDVKALKSFFRDEVHFEVDVNDKDLSLAELNEYLEAAKNKLNGVLGKNIYCFICAIMGHGNQNGIATTDDKFKSAEDIRMEFRNDTIPNYTGRPKIFLLQACRGSVRQDGVEIDEDDDKAENSEAEIDEDDIISKVPLDADTLLAFSTTPGYKSFRKTGGTSFRGSWFIQSCVQVFQEYYKSDHLEDMLITVRERVAELERPDDGKKQMPCVWSTLTRRLYLTKS